MPKGDRSIDLDAPSYDYPPGEIEPLHVHADALLLYSDDAAFTVMTEDAVWSLLPARAMWVPIGHASGIAAHRRKALRLQSLHFRPPLPASLPSTPTTLAVRPFMAALINELHASDGVDDRRRGALRLLMLDEIGMASVHAQPILRYPVSKGLQRVAAAQLDDMTVEFDIGTCAMLAHMSSRTFQRRFRSESGGMTWPEWVRHARLSVGRQLIDEGASILTAATEVGYNSPSAFSAAYRKVFGSAPRDDRRSAVSVPTPRSTRARRRWDQGACE